jgi:hypothetical protein
MCEILLMLKTIAFIGLIGILGVVVIIGNIFLHWVAVTERDWWLIIPGLGINLVTIFVIILIIADTICKGGE